MTTLRNRYRFRPRYSVHGLLHASTARVRFKDAADAIQTFLDPGTGRRLEALVATRTKTGEQHRLERAQFPDTWSEVLVQIQRYRQTLRGRWLMDNRGSSEFIGWAIEQILLGKPPRVALGSAEGQTALQQAAIKLRHMHRRAQRAEGTLALLVIDQARTHRIEVLEAQVEHLLRQNRALREQNPKATTAAPIRLSPVSIRAIARPIHSQ
jgi:hypothetical protein